MELVRSGFSMSPASERMRGGRSAEARAPPEGSWEEEEEEEEEDEETTSSLSASSPGVWVLPEEYTGSSPVFFALLGFTVDTSSCLGPGGFLGRIPHYFYVKVALARSALGNLDFLRTPGIWHAPVWCLSNLRSTGKWVFLGADSRISTSLCI